MLSPMKLVIVPQKLRLVHACPNIQSTPNVLNDFLIVTYMIVACLPVILEMDVLMRLRVHHRRITLAAVLVLTHISIPVSVRLVPMTVPILAPNLVLVLVLILIPTLALTHRTNHLLVNRFLVLPLMHNHPTQKML